MTLLIVFSPSLTFATAPTLADTPNLTGHETAHAVNTSFTYNIPAGSNQVLFVRGDTSSTNFTATQNTVNVPFTTFACPSFVGGTAFYGILANPTSGTFTMHDADTARVLFVVGTVNGADLTNPISSFGCNGFTGGGSSISYATTTPSSASTLLMDFLVVGDATPSSHGAGQTEYVDFNDDASFGYAYASYVTGSSTPSTFQEMSEYWSSGANGRDMSILAFQSPAAAVTTQVPPSTFIGFGF